MKTNPPPLHTAVHEAAHCVVKWTLDEIAPYPGPRIEAISVVPVGDSAGAVGTEPRLKMSDAWSTLRRSDGSHVSMRDVLPEWLARFCIIEILAGYVAQWRFVYTALSPFTTWHYARDLTMLKRDVLALQERGEPFDDFLMAHPRLEWLGRGEPDGAEFDSLYRQTIAVVYSEWTGIVRAARVLRERGKMEGDEFEEAWRRVRSSPAQRARALRDLERDGCAMPETPTHGPEEFGMRIAA